MDIVMGKNNYSVTSLRQFVIEDYNNSRSFSSFLPGIAGLKGIPLWVFYVNRGQGIASFGIGSKDKSILEFQSASKAYQWTPMCGFRTFIKLVAHDGQVHYWEPFQVNLLGSQYEGNRQSMTVSSHDVSFHDENKQLGLQIDVNYFVLPEENFPALVRQVVLSNYLDTMWDIEFIDGLPHINPFGVTDTLNKNIARTVEAWTQVAKVEESVPFFNLKTSVSDESEVNTHDGGYFSCMFSNKSKTFSQVILNPSVVFGENSNLIHPKRWLEHGIDFNMARKTTNRRPSALHYYKGKLLSHSSHRLVALYGYANHKDCLNDIKSKVTMDGSIVRKSERNLQITDHIKQCVFTHSSSVYWDHYLGQSFLDNVVRGGLPVSVGEKGNLFVFNIFGRQHGDLERDYNAFSLDATFFSQGNGNFRDVNQNQRNDVWFNLDVRKTHVKSFFDLIQVDGYNPLKLQGKVLKIKDASVIDVLIGKYVDSHHDDMLKFFTSSFTVGGFFLFIKDNNIRLKSDSDQFFSEVLSHSICQNRVKHGEGFWTDHWTYNTDLLEQYLAVYPKDLPSLLSNDAVYMFYFNDHYVCNKSEKLVLKDGNIRQYHAVMHDSNLSKSGDWLISLKDQKIYKTSLVVKILCILCNKIATLDPSGIGIEMEADKPNWCDALNGLPSLLGSSISESLEIKRLAQWLFDAFLKSDTDDQMSYDIYRELFDFVNGLIDLLRQDEDDYQYWDKSNQIKENYRHRVRSGVIAQRDKITVKTIKDLLCLIIVKIDQGYIKAQNSDGKLVSYFYHEVVEYDVLKKTRDHQTTVKPKSFKIHYLPLFLEGYVHAMRIEKDIAKVRDLYLEVRSSDLYDQKLKMYRISVDLSNESRDIGRLQTFPTGWLEHQTIWLHMEYKFMLEILRKGLYHEFYENFKNVFVPFMDPHVYGRSIFENSSFIVSSVHDDESLHGRGFVARLSGCTTELIHIWLLMNMGPHPFSLDENGNEILKFSPILDSFLFTESESTIKRSIDGINFIEENLPAHTYSFHLFSKILVVYHNHQRRKTYGANCAIISRIELCYIDGKVCTIMSNIVSHQIVSDIKNMKIQRIDVIFS